MLKFIRRVLIFFTVLSFVAASVIGFSVYKLLEYKSPQQAIVKIPKGASVKKIGALLSNKRVVGSAWEFEIYARVMGQASALKAGEYDLVKGLKLEAVLKKLVAGKVKLYKFTIPEGYNIDGVCGVLVKRKLMTSSECQQQVLKVGLLKQKTPETKTLEGYLFPETYLYESDATASDLTQMMVDQFYKKLGPERIRKAETMGFSVNELVTFASIVEKETGLASERPRIASVFHNRLKKGMLLQTDPTVIYGVPNFDGNLRRKDLRTDTPYNTYTRPGLPIGPIANPGLEAIDAVLNPDQTEDIYFVAKGDGSHYFSKTLDQHNKAVRYYQLKTGTEPE